MNHISPVVRKGTAEDFVHFGKRTTKKLAGPTRLPGTTNRDDFPANGETGLTCTKEKPPLGGFFFFQRGRRDSNSQLSRQRRDSRSLKPFTTEKKRPLSGRFFCGADETRTRDFLRDRQAL